MNERRDGWLLAVIALAIAMFFLGYSRSGSSGPYGLSSSSQPQQQVVILVPTVEVTMYLETATPLPTQTPWIQPATVTPLPTLALPWCRDAKLGEECKENVPLKTPIPTPTKRSCELITPIAGQVDYVYSCRKTNRMGTTGEDDLGLDSPGIVVAVTPTFAPYSPSFMGGSD